MKIVNYSRGNRGFTLLEMLLVIAIIAILASIVIIAINPSKQLADANNAKRQSDVLTILNAVHQYSIDNQGDFDGLGITQASDCAEAENTDQDAKSGITSGPLTDNGTYLSEIPLDPDTASTTHSSYNVFQNNTSLRITVCAPLTATTTTSLTEIISVTR